MYDIWGDCVNIASRFEACGHPEKIHITEDVKKCRGMPVYEDGGGIAIKGKGMMHSYYLLERKEKNTTSSSVNVSQEIIKGLLT
ncbi:MAG: hypothetical protein IPJ13_02520 [Saprospiraceae bacterium]|nr:hypothetical protein [Saprospiraceae bacterium]